MAANRAWMYERVLSDNTVNPLFLVGVEDFLKFAFSNPRVVFERNGRNCIRCPCALCDNRKFLDQGDVSKHLLRKGFRPLYYSWYKHGEPFLDNNVGEEGFEDNRMESMILDATGPDFNWDASNCVEPPNVAAQAFYEMLESIDESLWEIKVNENSTVKCEKHSVLSAVTQCLNLKSDFQMSEDNFNRMMSMIKSMLPIGEKLPEDFYHAKRLVRGLGMEYKKIDACPNNCMLYYKDDSLKDKCDTCGESRYKTLDQNKNGKRVARKVLRYLPITPRLQRLYMIPNTAEHMRWHKEGNRENPGLMVHPADGEAWKKFDEKHLEFAAEVRNVRLGLSTDGFTPYNFSGPPYSCWPVFVAPYNLPPGLVMKDEYTFLALVIPGPKSPGRDIDVFLQPLIDELKELWLNGFETFDSSRKQNFIMKAALMWTVNDFPAYEMLSGWGTHGQFACPHCMGKTKSFRLHNGRKACWFDCHRMFLPIDHPFRLQKNMFRKNKQEFDPPPSRLSGEEMQHVVDQIPEFNLGKKIPTNQIPGYGENHRWQKKSIFWELPYWASNMIRHNIDMMHLEKNWFENLFNTILDIADKTKNNANARLDEALLCNLSKDGRPRVRFTLSREDRKEIFKWLKGIKFPDGYASNWSRYVNIDSCKIAGLKSHDCHVFMERLLPVAFRDFLPMEVWEPITELSNIFKVLCAKELDPVRLEQLEKDVVVTICKLEKIFPPGFFDSMEHLLVHVAYEARVGGPVTCRWMYPIERKIQRARKKVGNKARPEGSICEAHIIEEISNFCSLYFPDNVRTRVDRGGRHDDGEVPSQDGRASIFTHPGRAIGRSICRNLTDDEYNAAFLYVLENCEEVRPFIEEFDNLHQGLTDGELTKIRAQQFPNWFRTKVIRNFPSDDKIRNIGLGPYTKVFCYNAYDINGYRFHTRSYGKNKSTVNSHVCVKGEWYDDTEHDYYGILEEIVELKFHGVNNKVVLFKCHWFDVVNGVRVDKEHGLVEIKHTSSLHIYEPFVFAEQSIQVYYLPYPSQKRERRDWWVAIKTKSKGNLLSYLNNASSADFFQEDGTICPFTVSTGDLLDCPTESHGVTETNPAGTSAQDDIEETDAD